MMTYLIETYGCQLNKAESGALELLLQQNHIYRAKDAGKADIVILNTCSVRKTAENRVWGRIGHYKNEKTKHSFILIVVGCMSQRLKNKIQKKFPEIDIVVGTFQKQDIISAINAIRNKEQTVCLTSVTDYQFSKSYNTTHFKAFVPVMHGCNNFCSYCIVPYVRGKEVSRPIEEILDEIVFLDKNGTKEITLLGQNVNSYHFMRNGNILRFYDILQKIIHTIKNTTWIRYLTSHPKDFSFDLIDLIKTHDKICNHIHLPVQHGSNKILSLMERKYTREKYLKIIEYIKNAISDISISTDILIGFPGEEEEDFDMTCQLLKTVEFDDAFTYYYNPREGTKAFTMEDTVPHSIKIERLNKIIELQRGISQHRRKKRLGKRVKVLVENISKQRSCEVLARTEYNNMVVFPGKQELIGTFVDVELLSLHGSTFKARII
jgi:tRNA-2-methylthio-N6-dimethylallyladenosine synthase